MKGRQGKLQLFSPAFQGNLEAGMTKIFMAWGDVTLKVGQSGSYWVVAW